MTDARLTFDNVEDFVGLLDLVSGNLPSQELVPVLSHICFDNDKFYAFDGVCVTIVELHTGLKCAVHGDRFISALRSIKGVLQLDQGNADITISSKDSSSKFRLSLPTLPTASFVYENPVNIDDEVVNIPLDKNLLDCMVAVSQSVSKKALESDWGGVNLLFDGEGNLLVCACDNMTLAIVKFDGALAGDKLWQRDRIGGIHAIIPVETVAQINAVYDGLSKLCGESLVVRFRIGLDYVAAEFYSIDFDNNDAPPNCMVISKLVPSVSPFDFVGSLDSFLEDITGWLPLYKKGASDIVDTRYMAFTEKFDENLKRAVVLCKKVDFAGMQIKLKDGEMYVAIKTKDIDLLDVQKLPFKVGDAGVVVNPAFVKRYFNLADEFALADGRAMILRSATARYLIGAVSVPSGRPSPD